MPVAAAGLKRRLLIVTGSVAFGLGLVGIFVPVLPTTPFLLLAATCYMRSSQRLYSWLVQNRFIGNYIRGYLEGRGMTLRMKACTLGLLWVAVMSTAAFATDSLALRIVLAVVLVGVTMHIVLIKAAARIDDGAPPAGP